MCLPHNLSFNLQIKWVQEKIQNLCRIDLNADKMQYQSLSHSFIKQETCVESHKNLFIQYSSARAHGLQWGYRLS